MEQEKEKEQKIYKSLLWSFGEKPERSMKRNNYNDNDVSVNDNNSNYDNNANYNNNANYDNNDNNNNLVSDNHIINDNHNKIKKYAFDDNTNNTLYDNINMISIMNTNMNTNASMCISQMGEFRKTNNKRELVNSKLNDRYSIGNIGQNPFNRENNYIKDLENQQKFMIPRSSYDEKM
jgi:hypothetical protein